MFTIQASRAKEREKRRAEQKGVSKGTNKDKECIPGCDCENQSLESIRAMCTEPMEHMMFVYIGNIFCSNYAHFFWDLNNFSVQTSARSECETRSTTTRTR